MYIIKAWVKRPGDTQAIDDTVSVTIKNLANPVITLPLTDGFETAAVQDCIVNTTGLEEMTGLILKQVQPGACKNIYKYRLCAKWYKGNNLRPVSI